MSNELNIQLDKRGLETKISWSLSGKMMECAALEMVLLAAVGKRSGELLPRLLADQGGGGIADYLAFHFESTPELGIVVPNGHVMCSDYFGNVVVPKLLFFGLLRSLVQVHPASVACTDSEVAMARLNDLVAGYQDQGTLKVVDGMGRVEMTFVPGDGIVPRDMAPHLMEEIRAASVVLVDHFSLVSEVERASARQRFVQALRRAELLGHRLPAWLMTSLPSAEEAEILEVATAYHRIIDLIDALRQSGKESATVSDLHLGLDWFLHVGDWAADDALAFDFSIHLITSSYAASITVDTHPETVTWEGWVMALEMGETGFGQLGWVGASCIDRIWEKRSAF
jgi:hypothetical protein